MRVIAEMMSSLGKLAIRQLPYDAEEYPGSYEVVVQTPRGTWEHMSFGWAETEEELLQRVAFRHGILGQPRKDWFATAPDLQDALDTVLQDRLPANTAKDWHAANVREERERFWGAVEARVHHLKGKRQNISITCGAPPYTTRQIDANVFTPRFAIHKDDLGFFVVDHIPTGWMVRKLGTMRDAKLLIAALETEDMKWNLDVREENELRRRCRAIVHAFPHRELPVTNYYERGV
jgi:hypothetical protein